MSSDVAPTASGKVQPTDDASTGADTTAPAAEARPESAATPAARNERDLEHAEESGSGFNLASAPTGRRVRARLARFNAPWQRDRKSVV